MQAFGYRQVEHLHREGFASVHVDELVEAFMLTPMNEKASGHVFNVVNSNTFVTYNEIAHHVVNNSLKKQN